MNCKRCGCQDTIYLGKQKGIDARNRRWYDFDLYNCNDPGCGTSFAGDEKRYLDDNELVPPREVILQGA
jgi:hypothetical protein